MPFARMKAYVNIVMSLCSDTGSKSVTGLSGSRHFHYHYSNLSKVSELLSKDESAYNETFNFLLRYFVGTCVEEASEQSASGIFYVLGQDMCVVDKRASSCLEGRVYGYQKGAVVSGYKVCFTHLYLDKGWSLPIAMDLVKPEAEGKESYQQDAVSLAVHQLKALLETKSLPFSDAYCLNQADSGYGNAKYLSPLYAYDKLINTVRFRAGMKVYKVFSETQTAKQNPLIYGETYYLNAQTQTKTYHTKQRKTGNLQTTHKEQISLTDCPADSYVQDTIVLGNGRNAIRKIWCWKNFLLRSKKGNNMKDKPFNILKVEIWNETGTAKIFDRDMWLSVNGKGKDNLTPTEVHQYYRTRFEVEGCYRFSKQHLFLDKFQTPEKQHFLNYLLILLSTWWILYAAKDEVSFACPVWQKYLPTNKTALELEKTPLTPSQVRKNLANLFDTFDKTPYLPQKSKKGKGREKGTVLTKREKKKPYKKPKKETKNE